MSNLAPKIVPEKNTLNTLGLISVTDICQNDCKFCDLGLKNKGASHRSLDEIKHQIKLIRDKGVSRIAFTGGEPTMHPSLINMVDYSASLGFDYLRVYSHGRNLHDKNRLQNLIDAGLTHIMISLFGPNADIHNDVAGAKAFEETVTGIQLASEKDIDLVINTPVTQQNYANLADYVDLLDNISKPDAIWQLSDLYPTTAVLREPQVHANYFKLKESMNKALHKATLHKRTFLLQEFPLCVTFPWHTDAKELGYWRSITMYVGDESNPGNIKKAKPWVAPDRSYVESCETCFYKRKCLGIPNSYIEYYGDVTFVKPI